MQFRSIIQEIENHSTFYFKEENINSLETFLVGYCGANIFLSSETIKLRFTVLFNTWLKGQAEKKMDIEIDGYKPTFDYLQLLYLDVQNFYSVFFELCGQFLDEYEKTGLGWDFFITSYPKEKRTFWEFITTIARRPGMFIPEIKIESLYYFLSGYCLAYRTTDAPHDEIDEKFCTWFGEWLALWIQDNIDADYIPESKFWYETVIHYTPEGKDVLAYFFELCNLFFDDYYNACGYFSWREKADIQIETDLGTKMDMRDVIVRVDGIKYKLFAVTIKTLQLQFEDEALQVCPGYCSSQPNMVVVKEITEEEVETIVQKWYRRDYFKKILPIQ